jgi:hypothetical protein
MDVAQEFGLHSNLQMPVVGEPSSEDATFTVIGYLRKERGILGNLG